MFRNLGLVCATLALFSIAGGSWAVLQTVAWAEMLRDYSQRTGSMAMAVEQTFDGQHPCELCREIQVAKAKAHQSSPASSLTKDDTQVKATLAGSLFRLCLRTAEKSVFPRAASLSGPSRTEQPPTPPPRRGHLAA